MFTKDADPIVAIATAPGRGAVGIVRISGTGLAALAQRLCGVVPAPRQARYGAFLDADGSALDHGLALFFPAPHSFTGEDVLELQAHGGPVVLQLLLARCLSAALELGPDGLPLAPRLRLAQPGEFTQRAFLNDKIDLAQAEAIADLIDASTEAAARSASRSLAGAFAQALQPLTEGLVRLRTLVEATLDFPEEDIDFLRQADALGQLERLRQALQAVRSSAHQGALLREGLQVVLAGQPNAGKSSLLNALAGAELAIVTPVAGTTRDRVSQTVQIDGVPLHVVDTAGLRESDDEVERIGIARAWDAIGQADVVLLVHDLSRLDAPDYRAADAILESAVAQKMPQKAILIEVWNKADCSPASAPPHGHSGVQVSAKTGLGLDALRQRLLQQAGWHSVPEGVFMARSRHVQALDRADGHLADGVGQLRAASPALDLLAEDLRLAHNALCEITGAFSADDLLGVIFSSFCIGK
ncbi:MAG: tRNA uridine-5-carboxymethylaminomethyl(34) synthesis GTPase MnmE [Rhodoferax sp.]